MPVKNSSFREELVSKCNIKGIPNFCSDSGGRKLAIDSHHNVLFTIWSAKHVLYIKLVVLTAPNDIWKNKPNEIHKRERALKLIMLLLLLEEPDEEGIDDEAVMN